MARLPHSWFGLLVAATLLALAAFAFDPRARDLLRDTPAADETTLAAAREHRGPLLWIDARPAADFAHDHIPEALPLNPDDWEAQIVDVLTRWQPGTTRTAQLRDVPGSPLARRRMSTRLSHGHPCLSARPDFPFQELLGAVAPGSRRSGSLACPARGSNPGPSA